MVPGVRIGGDHLPGLPDLVATESRHYGSVSVDTARLSPMQLDAAMQHAQNAASAHLRSRPVADLLALIDRVVANWLRPDYRLRQIAEEVLPPVTGFSPAMIRHGLPLLLGELHADAVRALLDAELG